MKVLNFEDIRTTDEERDGLKLVLQEITKNETNMAIGRAWLLWLVCTKREGTHEQIKTSIVQGCAYKMSGFIGWLIKTMSDPESISDQLRQVTIGTGATFAQVIATKPIFEGQNTLTWQVMDAPEEKECYQFSGFDIQGFAQGYINDQVK